MAESFNFNTWWDTVSIKDAAANARVKACFVEQSVTNFDALVELEFQHCSPIASRRGYNVSRY